MNQPHKHKDVIIAWANGEQIEFRDPDYSMEWQPIKNPSWLADTEYRVKPKEEIHSFRVALMHNTNVYFTTTVDSKEEGSNMEKHPWFIGWLGDWRTLMLEARN